MLALILLGSLFLTMPPEAEGRVLHLHTRNFSFQVLEPAGWRLETRAAPQIANFIFHPEGTNWRRSEAVIFARFLPRGPARTVDDLVKGKLDDFLDECPFGEEREKGLDLQPINGFEFHHYACPGVREEIFGVAPRGRYFVVFALSGDRPAGVEQAMDALRAIVGSFRWIESGPTQRREQPG